MPITTSFMNTSTQNPMLAHSRRTNTTYFYSTDKQWKPTLNVISGEWKEVCQFVLPDYLRQCNFADTAEPRREFEDYSSPIEDNIDEFRSSDQICDAIESPTPSFSRQSQHNIRALGPSKLEDSANCGTVQRFDQGHMQLAFS